MGQGIVLSANKTARATLSRASRDRWRELRAQRLRLIRALRTDFPLDNVIAMPMLEDMGELKYRLTVRLGDRHVEQLNALAEASGLSRNDVVRRILLSHDLPTAESLEEIEKLQKLQGEQNRLGGLLKKALTEQSRQGRHSTHAR